MPAPPWPLRQKILIWSTKLLFSKVLFLLCKDNGRSFQLLMKSYIFTALILLSIAQQKCGKNLPSAFPSCIQAKIEEIKKEPRWNPPASVEEYNYNGKRIFLFSANCCDQYNQV